MIPFISYGFVRCPARDVQFGIGACGSSDGASVAAAPVVRREVGEEGAREVDCMIFVDGDQARDAALLRVRCARHERSWLTSSPVTVLMTSGR